MSESVPTLGARLRAERERRGMSAQKVADEMHVDVWVIDALEVGDYQRIGPAVYAKGHLKRYASILGLSPALIATGYETKPEAPAAAAPSVAMRMPRAVPAPIRAPWPQIATVVLMVVAAGAIAWWRPWQHGFAPARPVALRASPGSTGSPSALPTRTESPAAAPSGGASSSDTAPADASAADAGAHLAATNGTSARGARSAQDTEQPLPATANPESSSAPPTAVAAAAEPTPGAGRARLRLSFSADSWVDVHDATGRRVFAGSGRANSVQTIAGTAPLTVYLGFASGVQLEVNDRVVAIGPQFVSGDVAHFEAGADGVLRRDTRPTPAQGAQAHAVRPTGHASQSARAAGGGVNLRLKDKPDELDGEFERY